MGLKTIWKRSRLRQKWHNSAFYNDFRRLRRYFGSNGLGIKCLMPNHLWLDSVSIVITTKCNLRCPDCSNLMQYYDKPYHLPWEMLIASMRKLNKSFDWCSEYKMLGGEPFLNPDLKDFLEEIPSEKCEKVILFTNATIIPEDPELFEVMRRKRVTVTIGNYPSVHETQKRLVAALEREKVSYKIVESNSWIEYGPVTRHRAENKELERQFRKCFIPCKILLNGCLYYCPRSGHGYDLGLIDRKPGEYVDILHNTTAQNRREIRRLMWRHKPIEACKYCQRGTDAAVRIPRGK